MSETIEQIALFLQVVAQMGTHVLLATLGGILCEKAGNLNLGVEGMMLLGASFGFLAAYHTASPWLALLAAGIAGMAGALIYAFITVTLRANHTVTGLVLSIFGTGVSSTIGPSISGVGLPDSIAAVLGSKTVPGLSKIPLIGKMLFCQSVYVPAAIVIAVMVYFYLNKTSIGLNTRMVGENPAAADASGINVSGYKYANIMAGGFLCGLGGSYLSLSYVPRWQNNLTAGAGWIAVALIIFSMWNPLRAIGSAYLFGALKAVGFKLQSGVNLFGAKVMIPTQILDMMPYLFTIAVLLFVTARNRRQSQAPAALGSIYFREDR